MKQAASHQAQFRVLDTIRRIEVTGLIGMSLVIAFSYPPHGALPALALLLAAIVILPRDRAILAITREESRREVVKHLQAEGLDLLSEYTSLQNRPLTQLHAQALWQTHREITVWLASCQTRLRPYPEFAGIYNARRGHGDVVDELDKCLACLSELNRLSRLSTTLRVRI